jgi:hypothetical protein
MPNNNTSFTPVAGEELPPARGKLWGILIVCFLLIPAGLFAAFCWWNQVELPGGRVLSAKAGIAGVLAVPLGIFLVIVMAFFLASAKTLVIGENGVQLLSRGQVVVHIPFANVTEVSSSGEPDAGVVALILRDRVDPETLVPFWIKDRYEIQIMVYGKSLQWLHQALNERLAAFRSRAR